MILILFLPMNTSLLQRQNDLLQPSSVSFVTRQQYAQEAWKIIWEGNISSLVFNYDEIGHLLDVRKVLFTVIIFLIVALIILFFLYMNRIPYRFNRRSRLFFGAAFGVGVFTFVSAALFPAFFEVMHPILFPQGNFTFPETSPLIQAFPVSFWFLAYLCVQVSVIIVTFFQGLFAHAWELRQFSRPISRKVQ